MRDKWTVAFPLSLAWLCVNCDSVGNREDECPACAGHQLLSVKRILDRDREAEK